MGTTTRPRSTGVRASNGDTLAEPRDDYDLLTAAALGLMAGAVLTLLFRRGPSGRRPARLAIEAVGRGASRAAHFRGRRRGRFLGRGAAMWDAMPFEDIGARLGEYLETARETIDDVVSHELKDLRKAVRRQRKRLGV